MDADATIRVLEVGSKSVVLTFSGSVEASWVERLVAELERSGSRTVIVDLLATTFVDREIQSVLIRDAERAPLTVVAEPWLLHVFELTRLSRSLRLDGSLSDAVAAAQ